MERCFRDSKRLETVTVTAARGALRNLARPSRSPGQPSTLFMVNAVATDAKLATVALTS